MSDTAVLFTNIILHCNKLLNHWNHLLVQLDVILLQCTLYLLYGRVSLIIVLQVVVIPLSRHLVHCGKHQGLIKSQEWPLVSIRILYVGDLRS